jgi:hypothetical protein
MKIEDIKNRALGAKVETSSVGSAEEISAELMEIVGGGSAALQPPSDSRFANATWNKSF